MAGGHVATSSITIDAPPDRVWDVITDPAAVKEFMFGADLVTDWTVGGPIAWRGEWEGKPYEDKGTILEVEPGHKLVHTHFSSRQQQCEACGSQRRVCVSDTRDGAVIDLSGSEAKRQRLEA